MCSVPGVLKIQAYSERLENEERETLLTYISLVENNIHKKEVMYQLNKNKNGSKFDSLNLKSNLKKINIFVKKLKQFSSGQLEAVLKDVDNLNLIKFLSEIVDALIHCNLKISDIVSAVKVSSELHLIYVDFATEYLKCWKKQLNFNENLPVFNRRKFKVDLIFFCELIISGIFHSRESLDFLYNTLSVILTQDISAHKNIDILYIFCKHCSEDFIGVIPKNMRILSTKHNMEVPRGRLISIDFQTKIKKLLKEYFESLSSSLTNSYETIFNLEKRYNDHLLEKGDIHPDKLKQLETFKREFSTMQCYTEKLSNMLDFNRPIFKKNGLGLSCDIHGMTQEQLTLEIWGDKETEKFYNELPCVEEYLLLSSIPMSDPNFEMNDSQEVTEEISDEDIKTEVLYVEEPSPEEEWNEKEEDNSTAQLNIFFTSLSNCLNKNMIDNAAIEFLITNNNKQARDKLVQYVYSLPRTRYDLFPFICRFLAIVSQAHPMIAKRIADIYYKQFRFLIVKKDQIKVENKIKNVKIISELLKFKLFSNIYGLYCLKLLLHDFSHHHIEMACVFLENCGKFLYYSQETHLRTKSYLEQILARKNNVILDLKYKNMIDSIYHMIIPTKEPSVACSVRKLRSVMHEFIRHVIYTKLDTDSVELVRELLEKLNWEDPKTERYIIQCLSNPNDIKFNKISSMAILVQELIDDYEEQMIQVIDNVLEDIKLGLEVMDKALYQRRIAMVAYLGELYNHCDLVDVDTIFTTLYTIITHFLHLESCSDLSRIALTLTILDICSNHFPQELYQDELQYFVLYFQHYFLHKSHRWNPNDSRFKLMLLKQRYEETLHKLYPNKKPLESLEESMSAVEKIFHIVSRKYNLNFNSINYFMSNIQGSSRSESTNDNVKRDAEDDSLIEAYDKLVVNSVKERTDSTLAHMRDITIPVVKKSQGESETQFFMLVRKPNHKPILREISIPSDSEIVSTFKSSQKSREVEMNRVKQITLRYTNRIQQESD